jgi:hypothetical protein
MKVRAWKALAGVAVGVAAAGGLAMPAPQASGQVRIAMSTARGGGSMSPVSRSAFKDYTKLLNLTEDQAQSATELFDGYRAEFKSAKEAHDSTMQSVQEEMQEGENFEASMKAMREAAGAFSDKSGALESSFMNDLRAILTDAQAERWPNVERHRRRDTGLRMGFYSGGDIDLISMVEKLRVNPGTAEFGALLSQYELDMDRRLQDASREREDAGKDADKDGPMDFAKQQQRMKEMAEASKPIRDLNRDYAKRMGAMMGAEARGTLEREFARRSFPSVFEASHTEECLKAAAAMADLDTTQRETVSSLLAQYEREAQALNQAWARAIDDAEEEQGGSIAVQINKWSGGGGNADLKKARTDRKDLDTKVKGRLDEVLTPSQRQKLPAKKPNEDAPGTFRFSVGAHPGAMEDEGEEE